MLIEITGRQPRSLAAGSQTVLSTLRFSPARTVSFIAALQAAEFRYDRLGVA